MKSQKLLSLFGIKWNPFGSQLPHESLIAGPKIDSFNYMVENLVMDGGYAMITGLPGTGKSVALRILAKRLELMPEVHVGILSRPQSGLSDFYREIGDLFGIELKGTNRWLGYKDLRKKWQDHIATTLFRPVLLIDEAQEMQAMVLNELRMLASVDFDSKQILTVILCGDQRLPDKFRNQDLMPLGSRIRVRLSQEPLSVDELLGFLSELLEKSGNPTLMTDGLKSILCEHATGNIRALLLMADQILHKAISCECSQLNEDLYFKVFDPNKKIRIKGKQY